MIYTLLVKSEVIAESSDIEIIRLTALIIENAHPEEVPELILFMRDKDGNTKTIFNK